MDEKLRILKMVEEGKVTAEQAAELIEALGAEQETKPIILKNKNYDKKMLRINVITAEGDVVNVQFPIGAVKKLLKATGKLPIPEKDLEGVDLQAIMEAVSECLDEEVAGDFVNIEEANGTVVKICVDE